MQIICSKVTLQSTVRKFTVVLVRNRQSLQHIISLLLTGDSNMVLEQVLIFLPPFQSNLLLSHKGNSKSHVTAWGL